MRSYEDSAGGSAHDLEQSPCRLYERIRKRRTCLQELAGCRHSSERPGSAGGKFRSCQPDLPVQDTPSRLHQSSRPGKHFSWSSMIWPGNPFIRISDYLRLATMGAGRAVSIMRLEDNTFVPASCFLLPASRFPLPTSCFPLRNWPYRSNFREYSPGMKEQTRSSRYPRFRGLCPAWFPRGWRTWTAALSVQSFHSSGRLPHHCCRIRAFRRHCRRTYKETRI